MLMATRAAVPSGADAYGDEMSRLITKATNSAGHRINLRNALVGSHLNGCEHL